MRPAKIFAVIATVLFGSLGTTTAALSSVVNISVWTSTVEKDLITEVQIIGPGGGTFTFADPFTAPDLTDPYTALVDALAALGLAPDTSLGSLSSILIGTDSKYQETVVSLYNPTDNPDIVLGDPNNYLTWLALSDVVVDVTAYQVTTNYSFHRLTASIVEQSTDIPAPTAGILFLGALTGLGILSTRRRAAVKA